MRSLVALFCVCVFQLGHAFTSDDYYDGVIVLANEEVLTGRISVVSFQVVIIESSLSRDVYPAHQVREVRFFDKQHNINRKFISLPSTDILTNEFSLFEEVVFGEALVLRKPKRNNVINENMSVLDHSTFDYYITWQGNLIPVNRFSMEVFPQVQKLFKPEISRFMSERKLNPYRTGDVIQLIRFYNKLVKSKEILSWFIAEEPLLFFLKMK